MLSVAFSVCGLQYKVTVNTLRKADLQRQMDPDLKFDLNAKADDAIHTPRGHKKSLSLRN